jgi:uncharacterized membrane protein
VIPIWVTWVVVKFVFDAMKSATEPIAWWFARRYQEGAQAVPQISGERRREIEQEFLRNAVERLMAGDRAAAAPSADRQVVIDQVARKLTYMLEQTPDAPVGMLSETHLTWIVPLLAVLLTLFMLYLLGLATASVFGRRLIYVLERIVERLPLIKTVYNATKQIVTTLGGAQSMHFRRVVLVEFPHPGMKCIGFLTSVMEDRDTGRKMATVFISTTPNPTTGYMEIVPLENVSDTNWTVEEAVKLLMSGGILSPTKVSFDKINKVDLEPGDKLVDEPAVPSTGIVPPP